MNQLLTNYGILILVILFIIVSLYYKNFINIGIFVILFLALRLMVSNNTAMMIAYGIALLYGIVKNFHLLENFTNNIKNNRSVLVPVPATTLNDKEDGNSVTDHPRVKTQIPADNKNSKSKKKKIRKLNVEESTNEANDIVETTKNAPNIEEIISEEFINKFIRRLKREDNLLVSHKKVNLYKINPTINKLSKSKVDKTKKKYLTDDEYVNKPIVITNDYFILDGHNKWFARKTLIENNTNGYNNSGIYSEDISVVIIDYNIRKCVQKLQEYKIKYNKDYLQKTINEINNIGKGKRYLEEIKEVINNLENNYNKFASIELI